MANENEEYDTIACNRVITQRSRSLQNANHANATTSEKITPVARNYDVALPRVTS